MEPVRDRIVKRISDSETFGIQDEIEGDHWFILKGDTNKSGNSRFYSKYIQHFGRLCGATAFYKLDTQRAQDVIARINTTLHLADTNDPTTSNRRRSGQNRVMPISSRSRNDPIDNYNYNYSYDNNYDNSYRGSYNNGYSNKDYNNSSYSGSGYNNSYNNNYNNYNDSYSGNDNKNVYPTNSSSNSSKSYSNNNNYGSTYKSSSRKHYNSSYDNNYGSYSKSSYGDDYKNNYNPNVNYSSYAPATYEVFLNPARSVIQTKSAPCFDPEYSDRGYREATISIPSDNFTGPGCWRPYKATSIQVCPALHNGRRLSKNCKVASRVN
jgi:hypothetical protein